MRRQFLLVIALALVLFPGKVQAQPRIKAAYASISANFAGLWMAKEVGAFEKYGLNAELVYIASGSVTVQAMMGGDVQMAIEVYHAEKGAYPPALEDLVQTEWLQTGQLRFKGYDLRYQRADDGSAYTLTAVAKK